MIICGRIHVTEVGTFNKENVAIHVEYRVSKVGVHRTWCSACRSGSPSPEVKVGAEGMYQSKIARLHVCCAVLTASNRETRRAGRVCHRRRTTSTDEHSIKPTIPAEPAWRACAALPGRALLRLPEGRGTVRRPAWRHKRRQSAPAVSMSALPRQHASTSRQHTATHVSMTLRQHQHASMLAPAVSATMHEFEDLHEV